MAYACPVCASLAPDGEHLAHHLAIVALTRGGEHETWLDEHATGWRDAQPEELATTAIEHAETVEHELADEAAGEHPDVAHEHGHGAGRGGTQAGDAGAVDRSNVASDEDTAAVLAEAREITRRMLDEGDADLDDDATANGDECGGDEHGGDVSGAEENANGSAETDSDE